MKNLLYKEFRLAAHQTMYVFMLFVFMLLIPSYPYYISFFYMCLAIFFVFLSGRESNDIFYTVLLPIPKKNVVKARCLMIGLLELTQIVLSVPFAIIGMKINPNEEGNLAGIEPNAAFYGFLFVMFAVFNIIMLPNFYKTAYKAGIPFVISCICMFIYIGVAEALVLIPSPIKDFLDTSDPAMFTKHLPILISGILIWIVIWIFTYKISAENFEKVDL